MPKKIIMNRRIEIGETEGTDCEACKDYGEVLIKKSKHIEKSRRKHK